MTRRSTTAPRTSTARAKTGRGTAAGKAAPGRGKPRQAAKGKVAKARSAARPRRLWLRLFAWLLTLAIWGGIAIAAVVAFYAYDLPDVSRLAESTRRPSVQLVDRDGRDVASYGDLYGLPLGIGELPPYLIQAMVSAEDRRFFDHVGLDPIGLARAAYVNLRARRIVQGGSTITQQLAKNIFLTPERSVKRKVQELLLALWLEHKFSKDQILSLYLNRVYFGAGSYGVDAAAERFFGRSARQVSLYEAALLAGLVKAPSRYNPANDPDLADRRARVVLAAMVDEGYIAAADAEAARAAGARHRPAQARSGGRYFADWVLGQTGDFLGRVDRDVVVRTTLDARLQRIAEEEVARLLAEAGAARGVGQAAVVVLSPDGAVRAMVGGRAYADSQFNRAVQALRQPGSAFKLFVYLEALAAGLRPDSPVRDAPVSVATASGTWSPRNYAGRYFGEVTLRESFARSLNSVAVRLIEREGAAEVAATARRLGISSPLEPTPSLALGASEVSLLDLTAAYAAVANGGQGVWPYGIAEAQSASNRVLYRRSGAGPGRVVAGRVVRDALDLLQATVAWGTGRAADPGRPAAGKTGTSQDFRDAWFVGFTADHVVGVWLGNDDGAPMQQVTGGSLPAELWRAIVVRASEGLSPRPLPLPSDAPAEGPDEGDGLLQRLLRDLVGEPDSGQPPPRRFGDDGYRG